MVSSGYSINDSYVDGGYDGGNAQDVLDNIAAKTVGRFYLPAFILICVLLLYIAYTWMFPGDGSSEGFNPTSLMRVQKRSDYGSEGMKGQKNAVNQRKRANTRFAHGRGGDFQKSDITMGDIQGAKRAQLMKDLNCGSRKTQDNNAWSWMTDNIGGAEGMSSRPKDDNDFSKILAGR